MGYKASCGNQSPDSLIDFRPADRITTDGWESVTRPLDRLQLIDGDEALGLGISHQTP